MKGFSSYDSQILGAVLSGLGIGYQNIPDAVWNHLQNRVGDLAAYYGGQGRRAVEAAAADYVSQFFGRVDRSAAGPFVATDRTFRGKGSPTITVQERERKTNNNMIGGSRLSRTRTVKAGRKKFKLMKMVSSTLNFTEQQLGTVTSQQVLDRKHLVSEYDPGTGGCVAIYKSGASGITPMHCYDLNLYVGAVSDNASNYPLNSTPFVTADINARAWVWANNNSWIPLKDPESTPRYYINDPNTLTQDSMPGSKVYRKGICIDYMFYGCRKTYAEYDVRVIKMLDPKFCPDYDLALVDDDGPPYNTPRKDFHQAWSSLVYPYTVNPMLKGIEPGPAVPKRWFRTVAQKTVKVGEQSADADQVQSIQGRIYVNLNEVNNMQWDQKGFVTQSGPAFYDEGPRIEPTDHTENAATHTKPHYRARYYLLIRALCPQDLGTTAGGGQDGTTYAGEPGLNFIYSGHTSIDYMPSYDIAIRTTYATLNGQL